MIGITGSVVPRRWSGTITPWSNASSSDEDRSTSSASPAASARASRAAPGTRRRGIFTNSSSVGPQNSSAMPMQNEGMWSRKKFAQCSGDTTTSTSARAASIRARSSA